MLKADKPEIAKAILAYLSGTDRDTHQLLQQQEVKYCSIVGSLLHSLSWEKETKYIAITKMYVELKELQVCGDNTFRKNEPFSRN